ncbi:DUF3619 family protein [Halioxenophilus sp. WMMB6]|uniref:DUF3619 family protein n=1 Tax=Halioxenophilus sp. WMMB6 TaxID=3073815 RepID=UPI00295F05F6|nr:DUF3619 family protein [Halioxenophilus sp. WMMB6]
MNNDKQQSAELTPEAKLVVDSLQASSEQLPESVVSRLHQARQKALAANVEPARGRGFGFSAKQTIGAGLSFAGLAAVALVLLNSSPQSITTPQPIIATEPPAVAGELELVLTNDDFELLANDLSFYEWLAEQPDAS